MIHVKQFKEEPVRGERHSCAGLCERWDALQGCWQRSDEEEHDRAFDTRRRVRFLERIQSHISSILGSEDCKSSTVSHMQEPLLHPGMHISFYDHKHLSYSVLLPDKGPPQPFFMLNQCIQYHALDRNGSVAQAGRHWARARPE